MLRLRFVAALAFALVALVSLVASCGSSNPQPAATSCEGCAVEAATPPEPRGPDGSAPLGPCNANNCERGCCKDGLCIEVGQTESACGTGGAACRACEAGTYCYFGLCSTDPRACSSRNCAGCCDGSTCIPLAQESDDKCGAQGNACAKVKSNQVCDTRSGAVVRLGTRCGNSVCFEGCCKDDTCVAFAQQSSGTCGTGGVTCGPCSARASCSGGLCKGACDASTCPGGCCLGDACIPHPNQIDARCGTAGAVCGACTSGTHCQSGACGQ